MRGRAAKPLTIYQAIGIRIRRGLTQQDAARAVGVSPRMWRYDEAGTLLLPKTVRLAALGYDAHSQAV